MKYPKDTIFKPVTSNKGFATNTDAVKLPENYCIDCRGVRFDKEGTIAVRDNGTKGKFPYYPTSNLASPALTIINGSTIYDKDTLTEHEVVEFLDTANKTHIYVYRRDVITAVGSTPVAVGGGIKNFDTISAELPGTCVGDWVMAYRTSDPTKYMIGKVNAINGAVSVDIDVSTFNGTGTFTDWTIEVGWAELTRVINCVVNDASIGAGDTTITIGTITEDGIAMTPKSNEFAGWVAENTGQTSAVKAVTGASNADPASITVTGHGYSTGDIVIIYGVLGNLSVNGVWKITSTGADTFTLDDCDATGGGTYTSGGSVKIYSSAAMIESNTGSTLTTAGNSAYFGSDTLNWKTTQTLVLYRTDIMRLGFNKSLGATPFFGHSNIDAQKKATILHGASASVMERPVVPIKRGSRTFFANTAFADWGFTLKAGWWGDVHQPQTGYSVVGALPGIGGTGTSDVTSFIYETNEYDPWAMMFVNNDENLVIAPDPSAYDVFLLATVVYGGYIESDPVWKGLFTCSATGNYATLNGRLSVNLAKMRKEITGVRLYAAYVNEDLHNAGSATTLPFSQYKRVADFNFLAATFLSTYPSYGGFTYHTQWSILGGITGQGASITDSLGHEPDITRTILKPRFVANAARDQGGFLIVDESDSVIRASGYSAGGHMDDVFPDVETDNIGFPMRINLIGRGELMGLAMLPKVGIETVSGTLIAFRKSEIEVFDMFDRKSLIFPGGVVSRSLPNTPYGVPYATKDGIYLLTTSLGRKLLNKIWRNFYNGDLTTDGTTSYITDAARNNILFGYDPTYRRLLAQVQVNKVGGGSENLTFAYSFENETWAIRKWNIGASSEAVKYFLPRLDGTLSMAYSTGFVTYPNRDASTAFEDDVSYFGVSADKGIETYVDIVLGSLYGTIKNHVLFGTIINQVGESTSGTGRMEIRMYANRETVAFNLDGSSNPDSIAVDDVPEMVLAPATVGQLEALRMKMSLPSATITDFKKEEINDITLALVPQQRFGAN